MRGDNLFSASKAMIPYDANPFGEQPGNIGTPSNTNDWIAINVVKMIIIMSKEQELKTMQ